MPDKILTYSAVYISAHGDTLSDEIIKVIHSKEPWTVDPFQQRKVEYFYNFANTDTTKFNKTWHNLPISWSKSEITGYTYHDGNYATHPFRNNQYYITEIAPFPDGFALPGSKGKGRVDIEEGWGKFQGKNKFKFEAEELEDIMLDSIGNINCVKTSASSKHHLGKSSLITHFNPMYGIVKMDYSFFNDVKLTFTLIQITDKVN